MAQAETPELEQRLRDETESAIGAGVFGIPTMRVDGELLWGLDQLQDLSMYPDGADLLKDIDPPLASHWSASDFRTGI